MKFDIQYIHTKSETIPATYTVICEDAEAKAFLKAINHELKWMEANRKKELRAGSREAATHTPYETMKKRENQFNFDNLSQISLASRHLIGQKIKPSFFARKIYITTDAVNRFIKECTESKTR